MYRAYAVLPISTILVQLPTTQPKASQYIPWFKQSSKVYRLYLTGLEKETLPLSTMVIWDIPHPRRHRATAQLQCNRHTLQVAENMSLLDMERNVVRRSTQHKHAGHRMRAG